jgi:hypothetical protein
MGMFGNSASGSSKAERPIVLKSPGGRVEIGASDSRGRYSITVTDNSGNVELRRTADGDRYADARAFVAEYASDGGTLRRQP